MLSLFEEGPSLYSNCKQAALQHIPVTWLVLLFQGQKMPKHPNFGDPSLHKSLRK